MSATAGMPESIVDAYMRRLWQARNEQMARFAREELRKELGPQCPASDEDIATVAIARSYELVRVVPRHGSMDKLELWRYQLRITSIEVPKPFPLHSYADAPTTQGAG